MESDLPIIAWAFDIVFGLLLAIVGFFVKQLVSDRAKDHEELQSLSRKMAVLEERSTQEAATVSEIRLYVQGLQTDMQWVRETLAVIVALDRNTIGDSPLPKNRK